MDDITQIILNFEKYFFNIYIWIKAEVNWIVSISF